MNDFFMPAEWHRHRCCWMGWPHRAESWPLDLAAVIDNFVAVALAIAQFEPIKLIVAPEYLSQTGALDQPGIEKIGLPISDIWLRDTGPTFVINKQGDIAGIDWQFNAWGENRESLVDYQADMLIAQRILEFQQIPRYAAPFVLEGGAIHVDGEGTLLTTEECLLDPNRNAQFDRQAWEELLQNYLGISQVIWLGQGLQDDETAGHIDNLACFVRPGVVAALTCADPQDNNYHILQDNLHRLRGATDAQGRRLEIIEIEQPAPHYDRNGLRLALSYLNFYIANGGLVMPVFNDPADEKAQQILMKLFLHHQVVPVYTLDLVHGGGNIHCITQQQPEIFNHGI